MSERGTDGVLRGYRRNPTSIAHTYARLAAGLHHYMALTATRPLQAGLFVWRGSFAALRTGSPDRGRTVRHEVSVPKDADTTLHLEVNIVAPPELWIRDL